MCGPDCCDTEPPAACSLRRLLRNPFADRRGHSLQKYPASHHCEIDKAGAPSHERRRGLGDAGLPPNISKTLVTLIPVKRIRFVHKVRYKDVQPAVVVKVSEVNSHRTLLLAIETERRA